MKTKRFFIFAACCLLCLTLTGCGDGKVSSDVNSDLESEASEDTKDL